MNFNLNPRVLILAVVALVLAIGTGVLVQNYMTAQRNALLASIPKQKKEAAGPRILVAKRALPAGLILKPNDLEWRDWPKRGVVKTYIVQGSAKIADYSGAVVRRGIAAGEPVILGKVVKPGERGFMSAVLAPGMRAVTIPLDVTAGIAGFVFPGDRVDLMLSQRMGGKNTRQVRFTETLFTGVRILAMDQTTNDQTGKARPAKSATIEVTPKQAEMVAVAVTLGKLSFSLRSLASELTDAGEIREELEGPAKRGKTVTFDTEVSIVLGGDPTGQPKKKIEVVRGLTTQSLSF